MSSHTPPQFSDLDTLFPTPAPPPAHAPARLPGTTPDSDRALLKCMKDNHVKWHIFFNDKGFHNHTTHHLLALYQMGANGPLIEAAYDNDKGYQREAFESPEPIDKSNFHLHLADENYYNAYLKFFTAELLEKGAAATLEEYLFSPKYNIEFFENENPPIQMLSRLLAGVLHPFIHIGYGTEFGLLGQLAEGLAETAMHKPTAPGLTPPTLWQYAGAIARATATSTLSRLTALLPSLTVSGAPGKAPAPEPQRQGVHALTILARLVGDPAWELRAHGIAPMTRGEGDPDALMAGLLAKNAPALDALLGDWVVDGTSAEDVARKIEELVWLNVVLFGVGGFGGRKDAAFNGDFFLLHLVTSSIFLHSFVAYLSPTSIVMLLRSYLATSLTFFVTRGHPPLPIAEFYEKVTAAPAPPASASPAKKPAEGTLAPEDVHPNPFLPILQSTLMHPDDHSVKVQRSLAHFAALYGARPQGHLAGVELEGAEKLDGSLFIRVAGLSMDRTGWMREGEERGEWDFDGF